MRSFKLRTVTVLVAVAIAVPMALAAMPLQRTIAPEAAQAQTGGNSPLVCIDPGHGGRDPGGVANGILEKDINIDISFRVQALLTKMGYRTMLTRTTDDYLGLAERVNISTGSRADMFVCIHNNCGAPQNRGTITFFTAGSVAGSDRLATCIQQQAVKKSGQPNGGVRTAGYFVTKRATSPAVLVECGYMTNAQDAANLKDAGFRQRMAQGIAAGIVDYSKGAPRFQEFVSLVNPSQRPSDVAMTFQAPDGGETVHERTVPPQTRQTVNVSDFVESSDVATRVVSKNKVPVVAEQTRTFNTEMGSGAGGSPGSSPSNQWHFAEGSTAWGFKTFFCIQNPQDSVNYAVVTFTRNDGFVKSVPYPLAPHSRATLDVSSIPEIANSDFSTSVRGARPIAVERSMYFTDHYGISGGHQSPGANQASKTWYFADGSTAWGFSTFVLLDNPNRAPARVSLTYMKNDGKTSTADYEIAPGGRRTVYVDDPKLRQSDFGIKVDSTRPLIAERSMYFDYKGVKDGTNTTGAVAPANNWYLAEGSTYDGYDTYVCVLNPEEVQAKAGMKFMTSDGVAGTREIDIPPKSRKTVRLNDVPEIAGGDVATQVTSKTPIVVERSMFFRNENDSGGTSSMGTTTMSVETDFAEGSTK